jgi:SPP1 gp7 family putative phage head morphogenesis protein
MPDSPVLATVARYRAQLAAKEAAALNRLASNYARSWKRLDALLSALLLQIGDKPPTAGQLMRMERYQTLMEQIAAELAGLQTLTANEVDQAGQLGITLGSQAARDLISTTITGGPEIAGMFNVLPKDAIEALLGFLDPAGPLYARLMLLAPTVTEWVAQAIAEGVTLGYNPRKIARMVQDAFGRGLTDALRFVRTSQLWAYREANRATMVANSEVVTGWVWHSALDERTCGSCIAMHGTEHTVDETLNDHHNGRCAMVPLVKGYQNPVEESGVDWFSRQPEAVQRQLLGPGKYDAWKAGKFDLSQLPTEHIDDIYGPMRVEQTLKELLAGVVQ